MFLEYGMGWWSLLARAGLGECVHWKLRPCVLGHVGPLAALFCGQGQGIQKRAPKIPPGARAFVSLSGDDRKKTHRHFTLFCTTKKLNENVWNYFTHMIQVVNELNGRGSTYWGLDLGWQWWWNRSDGDEKRWDISCAWVDGGWLKLIEVYTRVHQQIYETIYIYIHVYNIDTGESVGNHLGRPMTGAVRAFLAATVS